MNELTMKTKGTLFIISAPSGAGKTTLVYNVIERLKSDYTLKRVITYTSKQPRSLEVNGIDYNFIAQEEFIEKISQNFFVEHSTAYGAYYGFPRSILDEVQQGAHYVAILDRAGAESLKAHKNDAVLIWIKPPSKEALQVRLATRGQDSKESIAHRLALADKELEAGEQANFYHHVIINDDLDVALEQLEAAMRHHLSKHFLYAELQS